LPTRLTRFSVRLSNMGSVPIIGIALDFVVRNSEGNLVHQRTLHHTFSAPPGRELLRPGGSVVISPFREVNSLLSRGAGGAGPVAELLSLPGIQKALRLYEGTFEPVASVDLLIAIDGRFAGPDSAKNIYELEKMKSGYSSIRSELLTMIKAGLSDAELTTFLNSKAEAAVFADPEIGRSDPFQASQMTTAGRWRAMLQRIGRPQFEEKILSDTPERLYQIVGKLKGGLE
jgi:hypothetical protein